jgi:L-ascorbate metabolism protein UlaG (beta-lactamase superfamily)
MKPKIAVTRVTHSCHLIEIGGRMFLTDPWFSTKPGYYPGEPIAISIPDLPTLDGVLITHAHYDHCDLDAFAAYRDHGVPLVVASTVVDEARKHGFANVAALDPWASVDIGGVTVTAAPAKHGVYEVTFVLGDGSDAVYFAGDTLFIPELREIPERIGHVSLALLPTNGLCVRPANNMQVVMNADEAAELTSVLQPELALPHHYAFTKGWLGDRLITASDKDPTRFHDASFRLAPDTTVQIVEPGVRVEL